MSLQVEEARVRPRAKPCEICGRQSGNGAGFYPSTPVLRQVSSIPPALYTLVHLHVTLTRANEPNLETPKISLRRICFATEIQNVCTCITYGLITLWKLQCSLFCHL